MKKLLALSIVVLSVFLIYLSTLDRKVYFLTLSSETKNTLAFDKIKDLLIEKNLLEKYIKEFNQSDFRVTDFTKMIEDNKTIVIHKKEQSIKNALIKADIVVLDIGKIDLFTKLAYETDLETIYNYIDDLEIDIDKLLKNVRLYCKEDIYLLQIYNPDNRFDEKVIKYMNDKLKKLANQYKIVYVSYHITPEKVKNSISLNDKGQEEIYKSLNKAIDKTLFGK